MKCPHCGEPASVSSRFCQGCGEMVDLDFDTVRASMKKDKLKAEIHRMEHKAFLVLQSAVFIFLIALTLRVLVPAVPEVDTRACPRIETELVGDEALMLPELRLEIPFKVDDD